MSHNLRIEPLERLECDFCLGAAAYRIYNRTLEAGKLGHSSKRDIHICQGCVVIMKQELERLTQ